MANVQIENGYTKVADELLEALYSTDFSEPQQRIIQFIIRYSYGCNKKAVTLRYWNDLCIAGIPQPKIKYYLHQLHTARVIHLNEDMKTFMLNKNYDEWRIPPVLGYDAKSAKELLAFNLANDNTKSITGRDTLLPTDILCIPHRDTNVSPTGILSYYPQGYYAGSKPNDDEGLPSPKDSIKNNIKTTTDSKEVAVVDNEEVKEQVATYTNFATRIGGAILNKYSCHTTQPPSHTAIRKALEVIGDVNRLLEAIDRMPDILDPKPKSADDIMNRVVKWAENPSWGINGTEKPAEKQLTNEERKYKDAVSQTKVWKLQFEQGYLDNASPVIALKNINIILEYFNEYDDKFAEDVGHNAQFWIEQKDIFTKKGEVTS